MSAPNLPAGGAGLTYPPEQSAVPPPLPLAPEPATGRRRRRWILLAISVPIVAVLLALSARFVGQQAVTWWGQSAFAAGDYQQAADRFDYLKRFNLVDKYIATFNTGTAKWKAGNLPGAEEDLWVSRRQAPDRAMCQVSTNLARVIQDRAAGMAEQRDFAGAAFQYSVAAQVMADSTCPKDQQQSAQDALNKQAGQAQDKADQQAQDSENSGSGQGSGSESQEGSGDGSSQGGDGQSNQNGESGNDTGSGQGEGGTGTDGSGQGQGQSGGSGEQGGSDGSGGGSQPDINKEQELQDRNRQAEEDGAGGGDDRSSQGW